MRYSSGQVWAVTAFVSLVYIGLGLVGVTSGGGLMVFSDASNIVPALVIVGWLFEQWGWRWAPLHQVGLVSTPVVIGTWKGTLESSWVNPKTNHTDPPKTVYLAIRQTAVSISVRLLTNESASDLLHGLVGKRPSGYPAISYTYRNEPHLALQQTSSRIHHGAADIEIIGAPATALEGVYWTDRQTDGTLTFRQHTPHVAQTYGHATRLTYGPPHPVGVLAALRHS